MRHWVIVTAPDGSSSERELSDEQLTIGAAEHVGIRLTSVSWLLPEHVLVVPRGERCWVAVSTSGPEARVENKPFTAGYVAWNSSVFVDQLRIDLEHRAESTGETPKQHAKASPVMWLAVLAGLLWMGASVYGQGSEDRGDRLAAVPMLFTEPGRCGDGDAAHLGFSEADLGDAKRLRYVFVASDGIDAVGHYRRAALCFERAGLTEMAAEMRNAGAGLERRIDEDVRTLLLALERALESGDSRRAIEVCSRLLQIMAHREENDLYQQLRTLSLSLATESET